MATAAQAAAAAAAAAAGLGETMGHKVVDRLTQIVACLLLLLAARPAAWAVRVVLWREVRWSPLSSVPEKQRAHVATLPAAAGAAIAAHGTGSRKWCGAGSEEMLFKRLRHQERAASAPAAAGRLSQTSNALTVSRPVLPFWPRRRFSSLLPSAVTSRLSVAR